MSCASTKLNKLPTDTVLKHHKFSELDSLQQIEKRSLLVFLHTEWCAYCANMKQTTLKDESIIKILNEKYYFVSFDAEQRDDVLYRDHTFKYLPSGRNTGTHELALAIGRVNGEISYPTLVVLNSNYEIKFQFNSFLSSEEMEKILESAIGD